MAEIITWFLTICSFHHHQRRDICSQEVKSGSIQELLWTTRGCYEFLRVVYMPTVGDSDGIDRGQYKPIKTGPFLYFNAMKKSYKMGNLGIYWVRHSMRHWLSSRSVVHAMKTLVKTTGYSYSRSGCVDSSRADNVLYHRNCTCIYATIGKWILYPLKKLSESAHMTEGGMYHSKWQLLYMNTYSLLDYDVTWNDLFTQYPSAYRVPQRAAWTKNKEPCSQGVSSLNRSSKNQKHWSAGAIHESNCNWQGLPMNIYGKECHSSFLSSS